MVSDRIRSTLQHKSQLHQFELRRLGRVCEDAPLSGNVHILQHTNQVRGINTLLMSPELSREDFVFYFDRLAVMMIEKATDAGIRFAPCKVSTPVPNEIYNGLRVEGEVSAVVILRVWRLVSNG